MTERVEKQDAEVRQQVAAQATTVEYLLESISSLTRQIKDITETPRADEPRFNDDSELHEQVTPNMNLGENPLSKSKAKEELKKSRASHFDYKK